MSYPPQANPVGATTHVCPADLTWSHSLLRDEEGQVFGEQVRVSCVLLSSIPSELMNTAPSTAPRHRDDLASHRRTSTCYAQRTFAGYANGTLARRSAAQDGMSV